MGVKDHPVHPSGVRNSDHRSKCHSDHGPRPAPAPYMANNGWIETLDPSTGELVAVMSRKEVQPVMSDLCRQIMFAELPGCQGCTQPKDWEYINEKQ